MTTDGHFTGPLPAEAERATARHLELADAAAPGLVVGLYLTGSLGFGGEFHPARSDLDFVAVLERRPDAATAERLAEVLREVGRRYPRPSYDGFHIARADLLRPPGEFPGGPSVLEGTVAADGRFGVSPVTWHELARHAVPVRGPRLTEADVRTDDAALRAYTYANLTEYWADRVEQLRGARERVLGGDPAKAEWVTDWFVLGTARLHHCLATGALTSKDGAGRHALATFDAAWHPIVHEALRLRAGTPPQPSSPYPADTPRRLDDTIAFATSTITAALALGT